jgi:hypothetical protein
MRVFWWRLAPSSDLSGFRAAVADVKDLDFVSGFANLIIDEKRVVQESTNSGPLPNHATDAWEASQ